MSDVLALLSFNMRQEPANPCIFTKAEHQKNKSPVVMTTPANTFLRACGDVKLSVSSLNLSTTR